MDEVALDDSILLMTDVIICWIFSAGNGYCVDESTALIPVVVCLSAARPAFIAARLTIGAIVEDDCTAFILQ